MLHPDPFVIPGEDSTRDRVLAKPRNFGLEKENCLSESHIKFVVDLPTWEESSTEIDPSEIHHFVVRRVVEVDIKVEIIEPDSGVYLAGLEETDAWFLEVSVLDDVGQRAEDVDSWEGLYVHERQ